jgi:hypothetical protein
MDIAIAALSIIYNATRVRVYLHLMHLIQHNSDLEFVDPFFVLAP